MKTDAQLRNDVTEELPWDPSVTSFDITVTAHEGVVSLCGSVPQYADKCAAERASQRVEGVKVIVEEMEVTPVGTHKRGDTEFAEAVLSSLKWHVWVPSHIQATV